MYIEEAEPKDISVDFIADSGSLVLFCTSMLIKAFESSRRVRSYDKLKFICKIPAHLSEWSFSFPTSPGL